MITDKEGTVFTDLDTFHRNCKYEDEESDYSFGCSHEDTEGQCLESYCPFVTAYGRYKNDKLHAVENIFGIEFQEVQYDGYIEQEDGWGEDLICSTTKEIARDVFGLSPNSGSKSEAVDLNRYIGSCGINRGLMDWRC